MIDNGNSKIIKVRITAEVEAEVQLEHGETFEDFKERPVDIYLHGHGENGYLDKTDLGGFSKIELVKENSPISYTSEVLRNAISGYIEDCAGEGSEEAIEIEQAWDKIKPVIYLDDSEKENLGVILDSLEPTSELYATLSKVINSLK